MWATYSGGNAARRSGIGTGRGELYHRRRAGAADIRDLYHWRPLGVIHTEVPDQDVARQRRTMLSVIEVFPDYAAGLAGIEAYSHLFVLFGLDRAAPSTSLRGRHRGDPAAPEVGVFAARGRNHPNGIGLAVVELLALDGARLTVRRLDAWNGSPLIDLKPYDGYDVVDAPRVPAWWRARTLPPQGDLR